MKKAAAYPYVVWMILFILIPIALIVYYSFTVNGVFTFANYARAFEPIYLAVLRDSFIIALISTALCFVLGYPVAYIMARKEFRDSNFLIFLFLVPMWMNFLMRTYAWLTILEKNGLVNTILAAVGLPVIDILYTDAAVILGMVYNFIPFMILPIYTVLKKMDKSLIEAAQDLGANSRQVFFRVTFPLSLPGVVAGTTMTFLPSVTTFVISDLLGGNKTQLIGNVIEQQFLLVNDWNFGSALAVMLMAAILLTMNVFQRVDSQGERGAVL